MRQTKILTDSSGHVMIRCTSGILDDVIVVKFCARSKATVVHGCRVMGFPGSDVITATCDNDSEADDENEAGGNCER